ncbi:hypothetical protein ABMA28_003651 [Loxostege sticticalis]|uniref:ABC transporter domain-containing protein n=1 Tax=Loxostege sticticalis TaxID=481309 RepID=A0ABD0SWW5_LOXSC
MDSFQEVPTYENAKLTQMQRHFSPLLHNETVLEVAGAVPDALKLLATFSDILDHPTMIEISKNGLTVESLFNNPSRVRRYIVSELNVSDTVAGDILSAQLTIKGIFKGNLNRCNANSIADLINVEDRQALEDFVKILCDLTDKEVQRLAVDLMFEINFGKYLRMIGDMYYKLSGDNRITTLSDLVTAVLRMTKLDSYLPPALTTLFSGREVDFSYFNVSIITKAMDQLEPTFAGTKAFNTLKDITDMITAGLKYLDKLLLARSSDPVKDTARLVLSQVGSKMNANNDINSLSKVFNDAIGLIEKATMDDDAVDIFKILAQAMNFINKFLPDNTKHEVLFYSTLLAKLIEGANKVVNINLNIQEMAYDVSLRNPDGVKVLLSFPVSAVRKGFEGLADAERVQIVTSKLNVRGQIFCDSNKLASFFKVSKDEANSLKKQLCTDAWKNYAADFIRSFGIYDVRDIINNMASIVVQETFGKDVSDQLYTIDKDFEILKNFTYTLIKRETKEERKVDWNTLFNVTDDSEFMRAFTERGHLGKQILITVHGALAKEVVKQNAILDFKISPILLDFTTIVTAINDQLNQTPKEVTDMMKKLYPVVVETMLNTLLDEKKTYRSLSTASDEVVCAGADAAAAYLALPGDNRGELVAALCNATVAIENGLKNNSAIAKALSAVKTSAHGLDDVNWTKLINGLKSLYVKLDHDYPYLFEFASYGMNKDQQDTVKQLMERAKEFWFSARRLDRSLHLSIKLVFRLLDIADRDAFGMSSEGWLKMKHAFSSAQGPMAVVDDFVKLLTALARNDSYSSSLPPKTSQALSVIIPNVPQLVVEVVDMIIAGDADSEPITSLMNMEPPWPCGGSVTEVLPLSPPSKGAVKAMEGAICEDNGLQKEWEQFVQDRNISFYNASTWNSTAFGPHVFLQFSSTFDGLVEDTVLIKELVQDLLNDTTDGRLTIVGAWNYAAGLFDEVDRNETLRSLFANIDALLSSITTAPSNNSVSALWQEYFKCKAAEACGTLRRAALKHSFQAVSVVVENVAGDLITYFTEVNEPGASLLQLVGFTRSTALYMLFDKLPEFVAALLNSYFDYGFMSQIRRASQTDFWDCDAVLQSLSPAIDSSIDGATVRKVQPLVCLSLLHWISLPRGENAFLDVVAKPQYIFTTLQAQNLTSSYEAAFNKASELRALLTQISTKNQTLLTDEDTQLSSLENKLQKTVDTIFNYKIDETDPSYRLFNEINKKQIISTTYLARITAMVKKLAVAIENLKTSDISNDLTADEAKKLESDINYISKIFKRRPNEAIAIHFDVITNVLSSNEDIDLVKSFDSICNDVNDSSKDILVEDQKSKSKVCSKQYKVVYGAVNNVIVDDFGEAKSSLKNLVNTLQDGNGEQVDVAIFFKDRKKLTASLKSSIKYSYDLGLPIYLQYLQSNLQNYNVVLSFLSGEDWWGELRKLYGGPYATSFFDALEKSFEVAEDVLTKLDEIRLVRLLRDVNVNDTASFCQPNVTLADYVPDSTGVLSQLKQQICTADKTDLFKEIPPLVFASQGFDDDLQLPRQVNYTALYSDISSTESRLAAIRTGPKAPQRPAWITEGKVKHLRDVALQLLSKETLTRVSFGVIGNLVDAGTLFLNTSQCTLCSHFTTWFKQLNLQLYKKQEYDNLMCHLDAMTLDEVHDLLTNEFHWDMAFRELISFRNYTKYELNRSVNELLGQVKLHVLEDVTTNKSRVSECLARNVTGNALGHAALFLTVLAQTSTLIRAELPHLREVDGMTDVPVLKELSSQISPNLDVYAPLKKYLKKKNTFEEELKMVLGNDLVKEVQEADVNLRLLKKSLEQNAMEAFVNLLNRSREELCSDLDCVALLNGLKNNVNDTLISKDLPKLQVAEFWKFQYLSNIFYHVEQILKHMGRLVGLASTMDVTGVMQGKLAPTLDLVMEILAEDSLNSVVYSIHGILRELQPLLNDSALEHDLRALTDGLQVLQQYMQYLEKQDFKIPVSEVFVSQERVEASLSRLGINNTNFWSIAAPRIHAGHILLKPLFSWKQGDHIANYVCQLEAMSRVLQPGALDVVSQEDVCGAVAEQFCGLSDERVKELVPALLQSVNFTYVVDKVTAALLLKLYSASNLTEAEGAAVTTSLPRMAAVLPSVQAQISEVADSFASEPLFRSLANFSSVGGLLASSDFMASVGNMLCGAPFVTDVPRLYRSVLSSPDQADQPDERQLEVLPTAFCRSLYSDIISVEGGKIVWSFVKPLIMGRVLFTPPSPAVHRIIQEANSTFSHMSRLADLVHSFAASFPAVGKVSQHAAGAEVLGRLLSAPGFEDLRVMLLGEGEVANVELGSVLDELGDVQGLGNIVSKASDLLRCINLNRFHAAPTEESLAHEAARLTMVNEFSAGLVFLDTEQQEDSMSNIKYKIRMDIENAPTTRRLKNYLWIPGPEASFLENMRYFRGFVQIQDLVDKAIIHVAQNSSRRAKRETAEEAKWAVYTQQMPYPCYRKDFFQTSLYESQALIVAFFFSLLFTVASAVRFVVADKESGNTMLMSVMGVDLSMHTLSWFAWCALEMLATCACLSTVLMAGGVLPRTNPSLVLMLTVVFGFSVLCFCYMMSKLFHSASFAAVSAAIAYLITFMPIVLILSLEAVIARGAKIAICLSMSSSLCYAFLHITRLEAAGAGASFAQLWDTTDAEDVSIGLATVMMLVDAAIYVAVGWTIDRFFGLKTQSNITYCTTSDEKAGVSILNVTKIYGEGSRRPKLALDNVSMELHKGQVTTLLGHNGAGKTTLIKILMGMLKPTKGHVIIRSESPEGTQLGVCPQRDVLFEHMTAREHVALYAQLKSGRTLEEVHEEVESMLKVLNLGPVCDEPVHKLSGGTRRRLCVALAFVAEPHLVSLDEPTSGVDPAARRDIWSMIVKLKEERTILLTTHHLDEAELLSDQIVIMHKGQVHTSGSPIEIKRTLGTGYKLCVRYAAYSDDRAAQLLRVARTAVANTAAVHADPPHVELAAPFFDANGLNNDFLKLCTTLEANQEQLGFESYTLECSSLEQVFHNVCNQAEMSDQTMEFASEDAPSKSASTSSVRTEAPLVGSEGPLAGPAHKQFLALMRTRYLHYSRNRWLLFVLLVLPSLFVAIAMGFSMIRPPADNEISLLLHPGLYSNATEFIVPEPSIYSENIDPTFAQHVLDYLMLDKDTRNWTDADNPTCQCSESRQVCNETATLDQPSIMVLPDVATLNEWLVNSQKEYIQKRYGGFTASLANNITNLISWYNNKGHHALPAFISALNSAILRATTNNRAANITTYSHPMKISKEQISKDTVYQHVADAGISGLVVLAYSLVSGGAAVYLVGSRQSQEKRLQLLCGVSPQLYWAAALCWDMLIILINMVITAILMEAFHFPVFVERNNLLAICLLIILYGYACGCLIHVLEKLFAEASVANMLLFCGNAFLGLGGITVLLILDVISDSDRTDNARWVLHKIFLLSPQFALGDGLLEIAKNTIQAQVLSRFGMDTYKDPLSSDLVAAHYAYLVVAGSVLFALNLAIEYQCFEFLLVKFRSESIPEETSGELEDLDVTAERKRVHASIAQAAERPLRLHTIGNINAGFVDTEGKKGSLRSMIVGPMDVAACARLGKAYPTRGTPRVALRDLTLGIPPGQCTALLGENGAGKSTTFALLTGQVRPTAGALYLAGDKLSAMQLCKGLISYCPQTDAVDPLLTVKETLEVYCMLRGIDDQEEVIKRSMETFELTRYSSVRAGALSGGNKRKLCTALAFMSRSPLILLDEPTSGMDPSSRACVSRGVRGACARGRGVLVSTHALRDARVLAARVALLRAGRLCALAPLDECLTRFGGGYVVECLVAPGSGASVWKRVQSRAPHARLRVHHTCALHFLLPNRATVDKKEITTRPSDIFRLMAELQGECDIEDYAVNQTSLDQMFLSFADRNEASEDSTLLADDLTDVTAL